jgi:hypothetical protein
MMSDVDAAVADAIENELRKNLDKLKLEGTWHL